MDEKNLLLLGKKKLLGSRNVVWCDAHEDTRKRKIGVDRHDAGGNCSYLTIIRRGTYFIYLFKQK